MFNTAAGGNIMDKLEPVECEEMFVSFALSEQQQPSTRTSIPSARASTSSPRGVHQFTPDTSMAAALAAMANEIKELKLSAQWCEVCKGGHDTRDCPVNHQEQGGPSSRPNASVMVVSVMSHREEERVEEKVSHSVDYDIPLPEDVNKIDWRDRFAEINARMLEEHESAELTRVGTSVNVVSTRSRRVEEKESPVVEEEEPVDEEIEMEKPTEKAEEKKKGCR
ncbi:hypothetical protein L1987_06951 [Smallanthus sonchifolius]|uniref:Uncharacterized protein n=1 Tax=Smallanthus sonchifolius TaxID=185202 RepID=A0ACB9JZM0_9ASTR|nr:hypothetical protein L1987_06951 [Smallanthus sonchifolius]